MKYAEIRSGLQKEIAGRARIFSAIVICFLLYFGIKSYLGGDHAYALMLFTYGGIVIFSNVFLGQGKFFRLHIYLIIYLMASICLFFLYTGGEEGSGPLWYFVFPILALFVLGLRSGVIAIVLLFVCSILMVLFTDTIFSGHVYTGPMKERFLAVFLCVSLMAFFYEYSRQRYLSRLQAMNDELMTIARTDELTALPNRRYMNESLSQEAHRANRNKRIFSVILCDIDHFKQINDRYGHDGGDNVLRDMAIIIRDTLRSQDIVARWGGEEFLILLPETTLESAAVIAERLRRAVDSHRFSYGSERFFLTISLGVAQASPPYSMRHYLQKADENLYLAKQRGRNCVVVF